LAISASIVSAHNGNIWVESTPGAGATFVFTLPIPETPPMNDLAAIVSRDIPAESPNAAVAEIESEVTEASNHG
jgi:hypothetical protein